MLDGFILKAGQRWPIIPGCGGASGGAAALPQFLKVSIFLNNENQGIAFFGKLL